MTLAVPPEPRRKSSRRLRIALLLTLALVAAGVTWVWQGTREYYAFSPGTAPQIVSDAHCRIDAAAGELVLPGGRPCAHLVVPVSKAHLLRGRLYMVDVLVGPANAAQFVLDRLGLLSHFDPGTELVPTAAVLGPTPASQLSCTDGQQMTDATEFASVAALRQVGYPVVAHALGAQVDTVSSSTPAARAGVACNDLITAIDGRVVHSVDDLETILAAKRPGQEAMVTVRRQQGARTVLRQLRTTLGETPSEPGQPAQPKKAFLGVELESKVTYTLPFPVSIEVGDIGGPSAGLALTLGLLDVLSNGDLTGGHRVAATGTMDPDGNVGDVGGVAQKTVAVERAGAQLFLVPEAELAVAEAGAGCRSTTVTSSGHSAQREICPGMKVKAVSTLRQALGDLQAIGGRVDHLRGTESSN